MHDDPSGVDILKAATRHLRDIVMPSVSGRAKFELRVALSALELATREFEAGDMGTCAREFVAPLQVLTSSQATDVRALSETLAELIESGDVDIESPGLVELLYGLSMSKLAVDQPTYSTYRKYKQQGRYS